MALTASKPPAKRRRRNRRAAFSSDSSSSSGSDSSSDEEAPLVPALLAAREKGKGRDLPLPPANQSAIARQLALDAASESSSEESSTTSDESSSSSDSSDSDAGPSSRPAASSADANTSTARVPRLQRPSTSPSPPPSQIPSFFSPFDRPPSFIPASALKEQVTACAGGDVTMAGDEAVETEEELKKKRFRSFWMGKLVSGFGDDLDVVRQEPTLTTPRLKLLIDSLTSGIDVFSTGQSGKEGDVDERDVVLGKM